VVIALAPSVRRWASDARARAFVGGVTAAAAGAIGGAAFVLGRRAIIDVPTALIAAAAAGGLAATPVAVTKKVGPEPLLILGAAAVGLLLRHSP
jgi:chromate transporter